mmetsp:Transcript_22390/g.64273  ORF Transcript_22390/g.64273 Transcript_22390/m.64273 type:complete len:125 (-) Transcript_22390:867-1241(-)
MPSTEYRRMTDSDTPCGEAAVGAITAEEVGAAEEEEDAAEVEDEVAEEVAGVEDAVVVQNEQNEYRKTNKESIGEKNVSVPDLFLTSGARPLSFRPSLVTIQQSLSSGTEVALRLPTNTVASDV